jgi:hypothetical protein
LKDDLYLGSKMKRVRGKEFFDFADEFLQSVQSKLKNFKIKKNGQTV